MQTGSPIYKFQLKNLSDTKGLAEKLAAIIRPGSVITLSGDLGVGKTSFSRFFINYFYEQEQEVPSPSYTLVQTYQTKDFTIWHFDLYRINNPEEIFELGFEEALTHGVSIIEWPELITNLLPNDRFEINLESNLENDFRIVTIKTCGCFSNTEF